MKVLITEKGLTTACGKGILPGSILEIKGEVVPPDWNGVASALRPYSDDVKPVSLEVATPKEPEYLPRNEFLDRNVPEIVAELGALTDEELKMARDDESAAKSPRAGLLSAIGKEIASRAKAE